MWIIVAMIGIVFFGSLTAYLYTFFNFSKKEEPHTLPKGDDYQTDGAKMHDLICEMETIPPTQRIHLISYDGTRLNAR